MSYSTASAREQVLDDLATAAERIGTAVARLVRASQRLNAKVGQVAQYVIHTGQDPEAITPADLAQAS